MNLGRAATALANTLWLIACIPRWLLLLIGTRTIRSTQRRVLREALNRNRNTEYLRHFGPGSGAPGELVRRLPQTDYGDYRRWIERIASGEPNVLTGEAVLLLEPTSGSESASKLIPYTRTLQRQFRRAIDAWVTDLFLCYPRLLLGKHYWSISPVTKPVNVEMCRIPVGFQEDTQYLGFFQRQLSRMLFPVPSLVRLATDPEAFAYLTLLFLVRERNLRFISVWSPTFLSVLLKRLPLLFDSMVHDIDRGTMSRELRVPPELRERLQVFLKPNPRRAQGLRQIDVRAPGAFRAIWPRLLVVSCWTDAAAAVGETELRRLIPGVTIQGKGLIATEGVVTVPLGRNGRKALAVRSHFFEFRDPDSGRLYSAWDLRQGSVYSVLLTTAGGLYRYQLHDLVRVTGFYAQAACLDFIAREGVVSDLVGEKINQAHVAEILKDMHRDFTPGFAFRMLCPCREEGSQFYCLFYEPISSSSPRPDRVVEWLEKRLSDNYHYLHARRMGQLGAPRLFEVAAGTAHRRYLDHMVARGLKRGDVKPADLRRETDWHRVFEGRFTAMYPRGRDPLLSDDGVVDQTLENDQGHTSAEP